MIFILIRLTGLLGLSLGVIAFQFKNHKQIMLCKIFAEVAYCAQYTLLGAYTGGAIGAISVIRNYLFRRQVEKGKSTLPLIIIFSIFIVIICAVTWAGPLSLLPLFSKVISCISYGMKNPKKLRIITLPTCFMWVTYNLFVGSWEAMIGDSLSAISIMIAIYKFDIRKQKQESKTNSN